MPAARPAGWAVALIDGGHLRYLRGCQCSTSVRWSHGCSTATMGPHSMIEPHGTLERACRDGAVPGIMERRCCAREAGASPQARWVGCDPYRWRSHVLLRDCSAHTDGAPTVPAAREVAKEMGLRNEEVVAVCGQSTQGRDSRLCLAHREK